MEGPESGSSKPLHQELAGVGDLRRGTINTVYRRCGRPTCACMQEGHPGHGPMQTLTRSVGGKTVTKKLTPGAELEKVEREVANYRRFRSLVDQVVEVNEQICEARPPTAAGQEGPAGSSGAEKGGSGRSSQSY